MSLSPVSPPALHSLLARAALLLASIPAPGLGHALRGRALALGFLGLSSAAFVAGAFGSALAGCTCGLIAGLASYFAVGALSGWVAARDRHPPEGRRLVRALFAAAVALAPI